MGYTITDTVSCRLLPSQIAELRELAATEEVSLSRFVSGLCLAAIQDCAKNDVRKRSPGTHTSPVTRKTNRSGEGLSLIAKLDTE
jgi:hypothetical protein